MGVWGLRGWGADLAGSGCRGSAAPARLSHPQPGLWTAAAPPLLPGHCSPPALGESWKEGRGVGTGKWVVAWEKVGAQRMNRSLPGGRLVCIS